MILVTGGTGLVGMHLLVLLADKGENVRALYRNPESIEKVKALFGMYGKEETFSHIEWQQADIIDIPSLEKAFHGIAYVYHCAAAVSFDPSDEDILRKNNIEGTANIVNCCLSYEVRKLCFVSSIAALGDLAVNETVFSEETEWNPEKYHSDYAISKYGAEMEVWRAQQEGLQTIIVNPGVIIGPYPRRQDWQSGSGRIFLEIGNGMKYYTKGSTGFTGVWDVAKVMRQLMESPVTAQRFVLVSENMSFEVLSKMIAEAIGVKPPSVYAKKWMTEWAWRLDGLRALFFGKRKLSKATARSLHAQEQYSNEKIREALPFDFENMASVIHKTASYFPKN